MKSWKRLIACVKKDFPITGRDLIPFSLVYFALSVLYYVGSYYVTQRIAVKPILFIPFFLVLIVFSVSLLANQYWFQKAYSKKLGVPADIEKFGTVLLRGIKVYAVQFLVFFGIALGVMTIAVVAAFVTKGHGIFFQLLIPIVTIALIVFGVVWFYRLLFVNSILMYSRVNSKSRTIIQESKYLVGQNLGVIIAMLVVCVVAVLPSVIAALGKHVASKPDVVSSALCIVLGLLNTYFFVIITGNAVVEHKYFFLLAPKKENP